MADVGLGGGAHVLAPLQSRDPVAPEPCLLGEGDVLGVDIKIHCHRGRLKVFCKNNKTRVSAKHNRIQHTASVGQKILGQVIDSDNVAAFQ